MNITLDYLRGRRVWIVNNLSVFGEYSSASPLLLWSEMGSSSHRIIFARETVGGFEQAVNFSQLSDFRGNLLPQVIANPKVVILQKNEVECVIVGQESSTGFKIAKLERPFLGLEGSPQSGVVDLIIIENA